ncbi:MAG: polyketide synthase dehydratase domain-containing protein, partial [Gammaproteobacteria bacterium]|nr:polyketide synthase dehydratase domain-containing protein [Gammaproteobacteria bacterium]
MDKNYNEVKHYISCDNPIITDHKIHGVKTLPGVVLIDIVCRTLRKLYGAQLFEFNNVVFKRPVVAAQENDQYVVVGISKHKAHYDINVTSHDKGNPEANRENMSCQVQLIDEYEPTKVFDVDGFIAHCDNVID